MADIWNVDVGVLGIRVTNKHDLMVVISEGILCKRHSKCHHVLTFVLGLVGYYFWKLSRIFTEIQCQWCHNSSKINPKNTLPKALDRYFQDWPLDHTLPKKRLPALCFGVIVVNGSHACGKNPSTKLTSMQWAVALRIGPWRKELDHLPTWRWDLRVGPPVTSYMQSFTLFRNSGATKRVGDDVFFSLHGKIHMEPRHGTNGRKWSINVWIPCWFLGWLGGWNKISFQTVLAVAWCVFHPGKHGETSPFW